MRFLTLSLCCFFLFFVGICQSQVPSEKRGLDDIFASMLLESMEGSDLVAHVEVTGFQFEKMRNEATLYRVESRMLEGFKGPFLETLVFYQEAEEDLKEDVTGSRIIVTLVKSVQDGRYYVLDNAGSYPVSPELLGVARKAIKK